jgi:hypothetical protein
MSNLKGYGELLHAEREDTDAEDESGQLGERESVNAMCKCVKHALLSDELNFNLRSTLLTLSLGNSLCRLVPVDRGMGH